MRDLHSQILGLYYVYDLLNKLFSFNLELDQITLCSFPGLQKPSLIYDNLKKLKYAEYAIFNHTDGVKSQVTYLFFISKQKL